MRPVDVKRRDDREEKPPIKVFFYRCGYCGDTGVFDKPEHAESKAIVHRVMHGDLAS